MANPFVRTILRSRAHRLLSGRLLLLTYTGRGGRRRTIPILFARAGTGLVALAVAPERKRWWRTFRGGAPAVLVLAGEAVAARGQLLGGVEAREALRAYLTRFPRAASTLGVGSEATDVELTAAAAAVAIVEFGCSTVESR